MSAVASKPLTFQTAASSPQKRIAIFLPALAGGGAERAMVNLCSGFIRRGIAVDLVLGEVTGPYLSDVDPAVRTIDLKSVGAFAKLKSLTHYLKKEKPIGVISVLDNINLAAFARRLAGVKSRIVINVQNNLSADLGSHHGVKAWAKRRLMRFCYPWADDLTCVSEGVATDLSASAQFAAGQVKVIYNPIRTDLIERSAKELVDHPWFNDGETPILLAVGRLTLQKDYPTLLKAFAKVRAAKRVRLLVLGEGEDRGAIEQLVRDLNLTNDVSLPGFAKNPYAYMSKANVFVMSSAWEGLPTVMIEALACGLPVVSTDCPSGPREILDSGKFGTLVPVGDVDALAAALLETVQRPHHPSISQGRAASFDADSVVEQYAKLFGLTSATPASERMA